MLGYHRADHLADPNELVVLGRYRASVSTEEWARLGLSQLKKIESVLEKSQRNEGASER
jgi:hypothetical protein